MLTGRRSPSLGTGKGWLKVGILAEILELWPRSNRGTQEVLSPINLMICQKVELVSVDAFQQNLDAITHQETKTTAQNGFPEGTLLLGTRSKTALNKCPTNFPLGQHCKGMMIIADKFGYKRRQVVTACHPAEKRRKSLTRLFLMLVQSKR